MRFRVRLSLGRRTGRIFIYIGVRVLRLNCVDAAYFDVMMKEIIRKIKLDHFYIQIKYGRD